MIITMNNDQTCHQENIEISTRRCRPIRPHLSAGHPGRYHRRSRFQTPDTLNSGIIPR